MKRIIAYVRPHRLEDVKTAVASLGVTGLSVFDIRGCGNRPEKASEYGAADLYIPLPIRSKIEIVLEDGLAEAAIEAIAHAAKTGQPGDGKIFVEHVQDAIRVRTSQRGPAAL